MGHFEPCLGFSSSRVVQIEQNGADQHSVLGKIVNPQRLSNFDIPSAVCVKANSGMKPSIESLQNPKVKKAVSLRESRFRRRTGQILIDGVREIDMAIRAQVALEAIFYDAATHGSDQAHAPQCDWPSELMQPVNKRVFEKLCYGERLSGAVAIAFVPDLTIERLQLAPSPLILVLDRVEKPGNIGAVTRTAASAGAAALILTEPSCEVFNPNAIRASLGTVFSLPIAVTSTDRLSSWLEEQGLRLVRACVDGAKEMWEVDLTGALAIALGSEAYGLGPEWNRADWPAVKIPMVPGADSLNLSVSAAVFCYEALRQRASRAAL